MATAAVAHPPAPGGLARHARQARAAFHTRATGPPQLLLSCCPLRGGLHSTSALDITQPQNPTESRGTSTICAAGRRETMGGMALATFLPQLPAESPPEEGDCPTCVGGLNDTLGSCGSSRACKSSYDDR
mmetsp:Transcript_16942/g.42531  ORF Transcript_16942/g.42531 Transcript_16942/m.42531 type:complete len:130 (+) Transcript_16942:137-526(+)